MSSFICLVSFLGRTVSLRATGRTNGKQSLLYGEKTTTKKKNTFISNWMQVWDESFPSLFYSELLYLNHHIDFMLPCWLNVSQ